MVWYVWGGDCPKIEIEADSFDDALGIARLIDSAYCAGQLKGVR